MCTFLCLTFFINCFALGVKARKWKGEQLIADIFGASDEEEEFEARTVLNLFLNKYFVFIQTLIYSSLKMISTLNPRT